MAKFVKFQRVERLNPTTGELVQKILVVSDEGTTYTLLTDMSVEDIKSNRESLLSRVKIIAAPHGEVAVFDSTKILEEF